MVFSTAAGMRVHVGKMHTGSGWSVRQHKEAHVLGGGLQAGSRDAGGPGSVAAVVMEEDCLVECPVVGCVQGTQRNSVAKMQSHLAHAHPELGLSRTELKKLVQVASGARDLVLVERYGCR